MSPSEARDARGKATLEQVAGSGATGIVTFAPGALGDTRAIKVQATGLKPTRNFVYTGWLTGPSRKILALAAFPVGKDGKLISTLEVAVEDIKFVEDGDLDEVLITKGNPEQLTQALEQANEPISIPAGIGAPVMRGAITGPLTARATE